MILKGNARGGGQNLAAHLTNEFSNDRVSVIELRGAVAPDLSGAFAEWYAQSKATKGKKYLFSLSVNPDLRQGPLSAEQYLDLAARVEKHLKLSGQPRAIVMHVKKDAKGVPREHGHIVWSRTDTGNMRFVHLSDFKLKLRAVAREFAKEHGLALPRGMQKDGLSDRFQRQALGEDLKEKQQEERTGLSKPERVRQITDAWNNSKTAEDFVKALSAMDYSLAKGDRRGFVIVDLAGEVHSLSRQIKGLKAGQIAARLGELSVDQIPDVGTAQAMATALREARAKRPEKAGPTKEERRQQLRDAQAQRRTDVDLERQKMLTRHQAEAKGLRALQLIETNQLKGAVPIKPPGRIAAFLRRVTGIEFIASVRQRAAGKELTRTHQQQQKALELRHGNERFEHDRALRVLGRLDRRETHTLETTFKREEFQRIAGPQKAIEKTKAEIPSLPPPTVIQPPAKLLSQPERRAVALLDVFKRASSTAQVVQKAVQKPAAAAPGKQPAGAPSPADHRATQLREIFNRAAGKSEAAKTTEQSLAHSEEKEPSREPTKTQSNYGKDDARPNLKASFNRRSKDDPDPGHDFDRGRSKQRRVTPSDRSIRR